MATSGTVGRTVIDVVTVVEHAARKCGVLPSVLTAENLESARNDLFMLLTGLATKGINLWCTKKQVVATRRGKAAYTLAVGTEDLNTALLRRGTAALQTSLAAAAATYVATASVKIVSVIVQPAAAGAYSLVLEGSPDGAVWTSYGASTGTIAALGETLCFDAEPTAEQLQWRVRETVNLAATFTSVHFLSAATEVQVGKLSRGSYVTLPDKTVRGLPLSFWYDKQAAAPVMHVWQVPDSDTYQFVLWFQRQIEDVGVFSNTIDIPQRWLEAVIYMLAERLVLELPKELVDPTRVELLMGLAAKYEKEAGDSETDGSPIILRPNLRRYTRP